MIQNSQNNLSNFYGSFEDSSTEDKNINPKFNTEIESINNQTNSDFPYHYLCPNCNIFYFIHFCKDMKHIRITCSCVYNKKLSIQEFLSENSNYIYYENRLSLSNSFISTTTNINSNRTIGEGLFCSRHLKKFSLFCLNCLVNICIDCIDNFHIHSNCKFFEFKEIEINNENLIQLKMNNKKIDLNNSNNKENKNCEIFKFIKIDNSHREIVSEEQEKDFFHLVNIIINDYKIYPSFSHFFNIRNLFHFFNIKEKSEINKENDNNKKLNNEANQNEEYIFIEYFNNISNKTRLFSKKFVKNNKGKFKMEIEGEIIDLKNEHTFKTNSKIVSMKLIINKNISEINIYKMFANCYNLISLNGISILKKYKIINCNKMFYNCVSLFSINDFKDLDLSHDNDFYLMFYNCISLICFPYKDELNIDVFYKKKLSGIIITKYFIKYNEIRIKNIVKYKKKDNKEYINLFGNELLIDETNNDIIIIDGKKNNLISIYKENLNIKEKEKVNELNIFYKNIIVENNRQEIEIKLKIINKISKAYSIPTSDLSRWNLENVTDFSYMFCQFFLQSDIPIIFKPSIKNIKDISFMFYGCQFITSIPDISKLDIKNVSNISNIFNGCLSLTSLPDISKWDTSNITDMSNLFVGCKSLTSIPDIFKWNTTKVTNINNLFERCSSLKSLPDLSTWKTKNIKNMSSVFLGCSSLEILPDISNWDTDNVTNINKMFYACSSLSSLPDLSKWKTGNITDMSNLFAGCSLLKSLPDISNWNTGNVTDMNSMFDGCTLLRYLPDLSNWNTLKTLNISYMFARCSSLMSLPDLSKWNTSNIINMRNLFNECKSLINLPEINKWNVKNVTDLRYMFADCSSLRKLPDIKKWELCQKVEMNHLFDGCTSLFS